MEDLKEIIPTQTWNDLMTEVALENVLTGNSYSSSSAATPSTNQEVSVKQRFVDPILEGASFVSKTKGARVEMLRDSNVGMRVLNENSSEIFKILVGGTDVGDIIIGNYVGGQGAKWDDSTGTFNVLGSIQATTGKIGGFDIGTYYIRDTANTFGLSSSESFAGNSTIIDAYPIGTDYDILYSGSNIKVGQSFMAQGRKLTSIRFNICKYGSPTGNIVAKIYEHSGTYGSSSIPTGTALATSDNVNISTLSSFSNFSWQTFYFSGANQISLTNGAYYVLTIEYSGGNSNNSLIVRTNWNGGHYGNYSRYVSSWTAYSSYDLLFYIYGLENTRFWAGTDYSSRDYASFRITDNGHIYAAYVTISGGANATFISDTLDTQSKYILKDFTFGSSDYSGAFKTGNITWNTTTGAITGGSGGVFNKNGLVFANSGVPTITLDGVTGNATFAGTLSAVSGTLGTLSVSQYGYIKGGQTAWNTGTGFFEGYNNSSEVDQFYYVTSNISDYLFANGTVNKVGQGFSLKYGQTAITDVKVYLKRKSAGTSSTIGCDIYLLDNSTLLPTGNSLGYAFINNFSATVYTEVTFSWPWDDPVVVDGNNLYCFVISHPSGDAGDGVYIKYHNSPYGNYRSAQMIRYTTSWATLGISTDLAFEVYCGYGGHKFSVGNSSNSFTFNTKWLNTTNSLLISNTSTSDTFCKLEDDNFKFILNGQPVVYFHQSGLSYRSTKSLSAGILTYFTIAPTGAISNDVQQPGTGFQVTEGKGNATMKFTDQGLVVSNFIGNSSQKQQIYCNGLSACPLPTVDNALEMLDTIPNSKIKSELVRPEEASFEYKDKSKKRKYFDDVDFPDELTSINDKGNKDIELIRVIGFCFQAIKELNQEIKTLKKMISKI